MRAKRKVTVKQGTKNAEIHVLLLFVSTVAIIRTHAQCCIDQQYYGRIQNLFCVFFKLWSTMQTKPFHGSSNEINSLSALHEIVKSLLY